VLTCLPVSYLSTLGCVKCMFPHLKAPGSSRLVGNSTLAVLDTARGAFKRALWTRTSRAELGWVRIVDEASTIKIPYIGY
jgi:hypothetical protein